MPIPKDKQKFPLWAKPETLQSVKEIYQSDNCRSQSEFIERAILFYRLPDGGQTEILSAQYVPLHHEKHCTGKQ